MDSSQSVIKHNSSAYTILKEKDKNIYEGCYLHCDSQLEMTATNNINAKPPFTILSTSFMLSIFSLKIFQALVYGHFPGRTYNIHAQHVRWYKD